MFRLRFILEEFFRSFRKSLFKDILLMLIFSISIVMAVILCSYYFDMGERYSEINQHIDDSEWHNLETLTESRDYLESFSTVTGCRNVMNYYEAIADSEQYPMLSVNSSQNVYMREDDVKNFFGDRDYFSFLYEGQTETVTGHFGDEICSMQSMKSAQVDLKAYRMFGLRTEEGEGFTEENMRIEHVSDAIPIVLGNDYKGIINIGDTMDIEFPFYVYPCRVAGILEKGATMPENGVTGGTVWLDSTILFPYGIRVSNDPDMPEELEKYAFLDYSALDFGVVCVMDDMSTAGVVSGYSELGREFGLPPVRVVGTSMGVNLLRKESSLTVKIMLILTIVLMCFAFYGLFVVFYDKIQTNIKAYGIYLMNGCSIFMILIPCLLEIAVILIPSIFVGRYIFSIQNIGGYKIDVIMREVCSMAAIIFIVGAGFITYIMRGIDTEHLIRDKE